MPRIPIIVFFASCVLALVGCSGGDAAKDAKAMQGEWREVNLGLRMVIKGQEITVFGPDDNSRRHKFKLYPDQSPKGIDLTGLDGPMQGKTTQGIYELEGQRLKICVPRPSKAESGLRPKEFKTEKGMEFTIFERTDKK